MFGASYGADGFGVLQKKTVRTARTKPSQKSNPRGHTHRLPVLERRAELANIRHATETILEHQHDGGQVESLLALCAFEDVRGNYVPTLAEGYQRMLDTVNAKGGRVAVQMGLPFVEKNSPALRLRVFVQRFNDATNEWEAL